MNKGIEKNIYFKDFVPVSFKRIGKKYLLVNEWGDYILLSDDEFLSIENFEYDDNNELHKKLHLNNFLIKKINIKEIVSGYKKNNSDLLFGPINFDIYLSGIKEDDIFSLKKGFNEEPEMDFTTIDIIFSKIFLTNSKKLVIKIRGIKSLLNLDLLKYFFKKAKEENKKYKKEIEFELFIDVNLINDELLKFSNAFPTIAP